MATRSILPSHPFKLDFNGDGFTDLAWRGADGTIAVWNMTQNGFGARAGIFAPYLGGDLTLRGTGDINGDGTSDLIWQRANGSVEYWTSRGDTVTKVQGASGFGPGVAIQGIGDFNGDGKADLLWQRADGVWTTTTADVRKIPLASLGTIARFDDDFRITGVADFNGDGRDDILFRGSQGEFLIQQPVTVADRPDQLETAPLRFTDPGQDWSVLSLADFNGDGRSDILWQHSNSAGQVDARSVWLMNGNQFIGGGMVANPGGEWAVVGTDDYNNDGRADLMWHHAQTGTNSEWLMDGANMIGQGAIFANPGDFWGLGLI